MTAPAAAPGWWLRSTARCDRATSRSSRAGRGRGTDRTLPQRAWYNLPVAEGLLAGAVFAGLRIERLVASGGMGFVYLAVDPTLHRRVAVKVVAEALADDARYRDRFLVEARLAASLEHPAIVPVYAAGESEGRLYLAMRYVDGGTLGDRLKASGHLDPAGTIRLLRPIADALDTAHRAGLVHRDVKPGNILLQGDQALLADFGLAVSAVPGETMLSGDGPQVSGTMGYVAPEQIEGDRAGAATDQYALACVLFECLSGQKPFPRDNDLAVIYAHLQEPPPSLVQLRPELPRAVDAVMSRGLAKHPAERYGSCRDLVEALAAACGAPSDRATPPRRRRGRVVLGAALVVTAVAAAAAVALNSTRGEHGAPPVGGGPSDRSGVGLLDPDTGKLLATIPLGRAPSSIAVGRGASGCSTRTTAPFRRSTRRPTPSCRGSARRRRHRHRGRSGCDLDRQRLPDRSAGYPESVSRLDPATTIEAGSRSPLPRAAAPYFPGGGNRAAHRSHARRGLGRQSRPDGLPDRPPARRSS